LKKIYAIIAAAGNGQRFGDSIPKQFCRIDIGTPIERVVDLFLSIEKITGVVCIIPDGFVCTYNEIFNSTKKTKLLKPVLGGKSRSDSIKKGLDSLVQFAPNFVLIHDAARCYCSTELIEIIIANLENGEKAVIPAISPIDSVRMHGKSVDRNHVSLVQTPQGFQFDLIYSLHKKYTNLNEADDSSLCDLENQYVKIISGERENKKITFKEDITTIRTGFGFDVHKFSNDKSRKLYLMGTLIDGHKGLEAISDGDVGIHSIVDAILGAICEGDIGLHFPPSDSKRKNADSRVFLKHCQELLKQRRVMVINIDSTIVCESPQICKHTQAMKSTISECLKISEKQINIKGKTTERLGYIGRGEGIAVYSIATLRAY
jgi:2-C-methyl-D-erythritol 4-phosphate cytidylyltransferase/2-C-methyl-D-erythritol 2,4-cyclodiphosphate synthase